MRKRFKRYPLKGFDPAHGWQINDAGVIYRHQRQQPVTHRLGYLPTIEVGWHYQGVPSAGDPSPLRLQDELVAYHFYGKPKDGFAASFVHHLDGDEWNCEPDNLLWLPDEEFLAAKQDKQTRGWMRPDFLPRRNLRELVTVTAGQLLFVDAKNHPGWLPTSPKTNSLKGIQHANQSDRGSSGRNSRQAA